MKKTYLPAETWDRMQYLFRRYYDGMMHAVFYYDSELDKEVLVKAYTDVITRIPVLHSSYEHNPVKPRWRVNEVFSADDFFSFIETDSPEEETEKFITQRINPKSVCQIRIGLIRSAGKDTLCVVQNHMCADGGDFKVFNAKIAEYYSALQSCGR